MFAFEQGSATTPTARIGRGLGNEGGVVVNYSRLEPVSRTPFPHVVKDGFLPADLYARLSQSFPDCPPGVGSSGYSHFWGDPEYDRLMAENPDWQAFFDMFQCQSFVDYALRQFAPTFEAECVIDFTHARYVRHIENRKDKMRARQLKASHDPDQLWLRVDILQGRPGYRRPPHLDHRRRAVTFLIYFNDADEIGMVGGDLVLQGPDPSAEPVLIRPRHNRMVAFPNSNASLHSTTPILSQAQPRNFVQVMLSSSYDLWEPVAEQGAGPVHRLRGAIDALRYPRPAKRFVRTLGSRATPAADRSIVRA